MTDAEFEEQKARVLAVFERWKGPLWLGWWSVVFYWERTAGALRPMDGGSAHWETVFKVNSNWTYLDAAITAYLGTVVALTEDELEARLVHECAHILIGETRHGEDEGDWFDHEERVCTILAKAFLAVRDYAKEGRV